MKKIICIVAALTAIFAVANAETVNRKETLSTFHGLNIANNFEVTLTAGNGYSVSFDVDSRIADYCNVYVNAGVLTFKVDEKSFPKELKAQLKKEKSPLGVSAHVTVPEHSMLQNITLADNAILVSHSSYTVSNSFSINASDNSVIKSLEINSPQVTVNASKKAKMHLDITCNAIQVNASNNSEINLEIETATLDFKLDNSAYVNCGGKANNCRVLASVSSKLNLKGNFDKMGVEAKGFAKIDALGASVTNVDVNLTNCECSVNAVETLRMTLSSGAKLVFDGAPVITIDKISTSSVSHARDAKKK